jgi:hypothetical protein
MHAYHDNTAYESLQKHHSMGEGLAEIALYQPSCRREYGCSHLGLSVLIWSGSLVSRGGVFPCKVVFDKAFRKPSAATSDAAGNLDPPDSAHTTLPENLRSVLSGHRVALRAHHKFNDVVLSRSSTHTGNSLILFYPNGHRLLPPVPASIEYIVCRQSREVVHAVRRQEPATSDTRDPFRFYPHFPAKVYSPTLSACYELVYPEWVFFTLCSVEVGPESHGRSDPFPSKSKFWLSMTKIDITASNRTNTKA